jgi:hypothetical protein
MTFVVASRKGDLGEREGIVALLAHLKLPTEAPPLARARSPAFEGVGVDYGSGTGPSAQQRRQG